MLEHLYERHFRSSSLVKNAWALERKSNISVFLKRSCTSKSSCSKESKCSFEHKSAKKREGKGQRSRSPVEEILQEGRAPNKPEEVHWEKMTDLRVSTTRVELVAVAEILTNGSLRVVDISKATGAVLERVVHSQQEDRPRSPRRTSRGNTDCEKDQQLQSQMLQLSDLDI